jgi:hypothetical protein
VKLFCSLRTLPCQPISDFPTMLPSPSCNFSFANRSPNVLPSYHSKDNQHGIEGESLILGAKRWILLSTAYRQQILWFEFNSGQPFSFCRLTSSVHSARSTKKCALIKAGF